MRLGAIGFSSYLRRAYIPYIKQRSDLQLNAVCDILEPADLDRLVEDTKLDSRPALFRDLRTMLSAVHLDAVIISTPHVFHFEQAKACLEAGLHVMVDKPLACRSHEAEFLVALAESKSLKLAVANQRRYEPVYKYVKRAIDQERLGEIRLINYLFANSPWYDYSQSWRGDPSMSGGGALIDIGYLAVDMINWLLGRQLQWIDAVTPSPENNQTEQSVALLAEFTPSVLVSLTVSYEAPVPSVQEELSIYGLCGSIFTRRFCSKRSDAPPLLIEQSTSGEVHQISFTTDPDNSKPLDDFLRSIEEGTPMVSDGRSNLATVEFIDAAYRSIREQIKVTVDD
jgi:predicted dehydrogenase